MSKAKLLTNREAEGSLKIGKKIKRGKLALLGFCSRLVFVFAVCFEAIVINSWPISLAQAANPMSFSIDYDVSVAYVPIGIASLAMVDKNAAYQLNFSSELTGLPRLLFASKITAASEGRIKVNRLYPSRYQFFIDYPKDPMRIEMSITDGAVNSSSISPPEQPRADRVPVSPEDRLNIIDPLSAFLLPYNGEIKADQICNQVIKIFDGSARFDISLNPQGETVIDIEGYKGPAVTCNAHYSPISGHQKERANVKYMKKNKEIYVSLVPIRGRNLLVPVKFEIATTIGNLRIKAVNLKGF